MEGILLYRNGEELVLLLPEVLGRVLLSLQSGVEGWEEAFGKTLAEASHHLPREPLEALVEEAPRLMAEAALEAVGRLLERGRVALGEGHLEEALALARQGSYLGGALDLGEAARALALWGDPVRLGDIEGIFPGRFDRVARRGQGEPSRRPSSLPRRRPSSAPRSACGGLALMPQGASSRLRASRPSQRCPCKGRKPKRAKAPPPRAKGKSSRRRPSQRRKTPRPQGRARRATHLHR